MINWPVHIVSAAGYVFDSAGNLLIVKTRDRGWEVPGGQIEEGETLIEGVLREIREESGICAKVNRLLGVYSNIQKKIFYDHVTEVPTMVTFDFFCTYVSGETSVSDETTDVQWVPKEKALEFIENATNRYRAHRALSFDGRITYASYVTRPVFKVYSEQFVS